MFARECCRQIMSQDMLMVYVLQSYLARHPQLAVWWQCFDSSGGGAGMGERALELMGKRALQRVAFKTAIAQHGAFQ